MKVPLHLVRARREQMAALLRERGYLPVAELCARFGISEATARRDLQSLAREEKVTRTHGGALGDYDRSFASFAERKTRAAEGKERIARAAHGLIRPGQTVFFDAGTTLLALARQVACQPVAGLKVITNSLPVAEALGNAGGVRIFLTGGEYLNRQAAFLGEVACATLKLWKFDAAFLGGEALTPRGILNSHADLTRFQRMVMRRSGVTRFLIDRTKLGAEAPALLVGWEAVSVLVSDVTQPQLREAGIPLRRNHLVSVS